MRPALPRQPGTAACSTAVLILIVAAQLPARAQQSSSGSPAKAVISSGVSEPRVVSDASAGLRDPATAAAWTASNNPLLNTTSQAYRQNPVVTAAAQMPAGDGSGLRQRSPSVQSAQTSVSKQIPLSPPSPKFTGSEPAAAGGTLQMILSVGSSLLVVVGLFLGVAWCYRKTLSSSLGNGIPKQVVSILGRTPLSTRQQMVLVRFGSKLLLVSVIQGEARTLSEITDPLEVDQLLGLCESGQPGSITSSFKSVLLQEGGR